MVIDHQKTWWTFATKLEQHQAVHCRSNVIRIFIFPFIRYITQTPLINGSRSSRMNPRNRDNFIWTKIRKSPCNITFLARQYVDSRHKSVASRQTTVAFGCTDINDAGVPWGQREKRLFVLNVAASGHIVASALAAVQMFFFFNQVKIKYVFQKKDVLFFDKISIHLSKLNCLYLVFFWARDLPVLIV